MVSRLMGDSTALASAIVRCCLNTDVTKIVELECYKALAKVKAIIENDALADSECFQQIEEIVCTFQELGSGGGTRHNFG